jgi:heme/copper-type cytochrome/quinol oxidase subunit 3
MSHEAHSRFLLLPGERLGIAGLYWFLASEAALFGGLLLATLYLRAGSSGWGGAAEHLSFGTALVATALLFAAAGFLRKASTRDGDVSLLWLVASIVPGLAFLALKATDFRSHWADGFRPDASVFWASYFLLTGLHGLHVAAGVAVCGWIGLQMWRRPVWRTGPVWLLGVRLYWYFVDAVWLSLLWLFYLS